MVNMGRNNRNDKAILSIQPQTANSYPKIIGMCEKNICLYKEIVHISQLQF